MPVVQHSYADVVTAFVAMASHKWVESIAVAAAFVAAGSGMLSVIAFLVRYHQFWHFFHH